MAMIYRERGADILIFPGAFNMTTGPAHWQLLQQARALDNQLFVCSCSPARVENFSYVAWGHSLVVGPFGEVLGELGHEEGVLYCEIDLEQIKQHRSGLPVGLQKRSDLYGLVDKRPKY
jgi:omega-amidase